MLRALDTARRPATAGVPGAKLEAARDRRVAAALLLLYLVLYLLPLGIRPMASPDEVRYGAIAHEMLAHGDWISPRFDGVRYFEKPVLGYWLDAASFAVFGESPFALRLPGALATGLTALIVFGLARRYVSRLAAGVGAAIYLTTFLVAGIGTFAVLDAFLALFLTGALASFFVATETPDAGRRRRWLAMCGAACGAAFLVKGFLALAIPVLVAGPYLAARRRWRTLWTAPWWPIAVAALVALPWSVAIALREPDFWHYFFWVEHIQRFTASDAQHAQPFWYYFAWLPIAGWPWLWLLPAALLGLAKGRAEFPERTRALLWYAAAWAGLPLLFFSLSKGKLPTYILPCFAPLAVLLAAGLERALPGPGRRAFSIAAGLVAAVFAALGGALLAAQAGALAQPVFGPAERLKLAAFVLFMAAGAACGLYAVLARARGRRLAAFAGTGAALILPLQVAPPQRALDNVSPSLAVTRYAEAAPDALVVSDAPLFGTAAWVLGRDDIYVLSPGEIEYGLSYPQSRDRLLDAAAFARLVAANRGRRPILVVCGRATDREIAPLMPPRARRSQHGEVVFWHIPPA